MKDGPPKDNYMLFSIPYILDYLTQVLVIYGIGGKDTFPIYLPRSEGPAVSYIVSREGGRNWDSNLTMIPFLEFMDILA